MLVSSKGYGIFWNNASRSRVITGLPTPLYQLEVPMSSITLHLRPGHGQDYRRLPRTDRASADVRQVAYGFWQSRTGTSHRRKSWGSPEYRTCIFRHNIVQDWSGGHTRRAVFNKNYPIEGMVRNSTKRIFT